METKSLFERLGGTSGIERIVDEVASRHLENPVIGARFRPYLEQPGKLDELKVHLARFLEMGSGGPPRYTGRDMRSAHRGMNISPGEYVAALDDILAALVQTGVEEQARKDVLAIAWSLKGEIIQV
ncbi:MAG: group 1 truncated hemoglobin [Polyangiaceae bacterium]|nr:group 1 truncated hemoglobin [Polyangiaceae bacterium]